MKRILIIFGTRPEAIKLAPLIHEFYKYPDEFNICVCVSAQHRNMLDQVLKLFEISPDYDLDIMGTNQDLYQITSKVLEGLKNILSQFRPHFVIIQGDTTTSFAAALASFYQQIYVAHIEAGLRTHNIYSPFPEELNRQLISRISLFHFAPTVRNKQTLIHEGISEDSIIITGNTGIDSLHMVLEKIKNGTKYRNALERLLKGLGYSISKRRIILVTGHRRENFGKGLENICLALRYIADQNSDTDIVYPVHLNPNVQEPVKALLSGLENVFLIEPLDFDVHVYLMSRSYLILTDSGGIQEEAPSLNKPVLVMREFTERTEALEAGISRIVGTKSETIIDQVRILLSNKEEYNKMVSSYNPFGDGKASQRVVGFFRKVQQH